MADDCRAIVPSAQQVGSKVTYLPLARLGGPELYDTPASSTIEALDSLTWAYVTQFDIAATRDGGATYKAFFRGRSRGDFRQPRHFLWYSYDTMVIIGYGSSFSTLLQRTTDAGETWHDLPCPIAPRPVGRAFGNKAGLLVVTADPDSVLYVSSDRGTTWQTLPRPVFYDDVTPTILNGMIAEDGVVYASMRSYPHWAFARSLDSCKTWEFSDMSCFTPNAQVVLPDGSLLWTSPKAAEVDSNGAPLNDRVMQSISLQDHFGGAQRVVLQEATIGVGAVPRTPRWTDRGIVLATATEGTFVSTDLGRTWCTDTAARVKTEGVIWGFLGAPLTHTSFVCAIMGADSLAILDYSHLVEPTHVREHGQEQEIDVVRVFDLLGRALATIPRVEHGNFESLALTIRQAVGSGAYIAMTARKTELILVE